MDAKFNCQNKEDHHNTECGIKNEPMVFEDEFENGDPQKNSKQLLDNIAQVKQESDQDERQETCLNICPGAADGLELKQEPADHKTNKDIEELYADHEVKEEMVVGPVMLLESIPTQTNLNQESTKSNMQLHCRARKTYSPRRTTLQLSKKNKSQAQICKIIRNEYKYETGLINHMASHATVNGVTVKTERQNNRYKNITYNKKARSADDATVASQNSVTRNHDNSIQKYICDICQKVFEAKSDIITHMNIHNHRSSKGNYCCEICNKCFSSSSNLKKHRELHSTKYFTCDICQKAFRQKYSLSRHKQLHGNTYFKCDMCPKAFKHKRCLARHKELHSDTYFTCNVCQKAFKQKSCLAKHKKIHSNTYFTCNVCQKAFKQKQSLARHKEVHSNTNFTCDICQKAFKQKQCLARHKELHSNTYFTCDICQKAFKHKRCLARHKELHSDTYFTCNVCQKAFKQKSCLAKHKKIHSNTYFTCNVCQKAFKQKDCLVRHMIHNHRGSNKAKFFCDVCNKCFKYGHSLKRHKMVMRAVETHRVLPPAAQAQLY